MPIECPQQPLQHGSAQTAALFAPMGAIKLNKDTLAWNVEGQTVSLDTVKRVIQPPLCSTASS